ncbi:MAG: VWA domain-containing protein [Pyrinomonadaceae bacterium]|nr:VWA domain-containing protein [Pyrinomonadaceae bacterium]
MAKVLYAFIWLAGFVIASASGVSAQTQANEEVIKIDTTLVSVPVIVSDRQGHYISGLQTKDFKIFQDGIEQKIDFFAASEEPLNVAVLIDTSRSTSEVLDEIKDAAKSFVKLLNTNDKAMIVTFDYEPHVLSKLTSSKTDLNRAIEAAEIGGQYGTTLNDAVNEVVEKIFKEIKGRKAIILLTDGKDFGSATESDDLLYSLQESDTLIYPIFYKTGGLGLDGAADSAIVFLFRKGEMDA